MASTRIIQQSFNGGEVTPEFFGRLDDAKRQSGVATMRNFIATPQGPATQRPGTVFVAEAWPVNLGVSRLIPFVYSATQSLVIELSSSGMRFYTEGGVLKFVHADTSVWSNLTTYSNGQLVHVSDGAGGYYYYRSAVSNNLNHAPVAGASSIYWHILPETKELQIISDYWSQMIASVNYAQSNDVLTLVHPLRPPRELRRKSSVVWEFVDISFLPEIAAPTGLTHKAAISVGSGSGSEFHYYKVAAVGESAANESLPSSVSSSAASITAIAQAWGGAITTSAAHGAAVGQRVYIGGVSGMTQINGLTAYVYSVPSANQITLKDEVGAVIDTSAYSAYTSGGTLTIYGVRNDLLTTGNKNGISWTAVAGAVRYNVYKESNGIYGYIGQTDRTVFVDDNIAPDLGKTPQESYTPFSGYGNYPAAVAYWEQRRVFAGTENQSQNVWMTRTGTESNLSYSIPSRDDDGIGFRIASRENNAIRHIVPIGDLMLMTNAAEWRVSTDGAVTPTSISVRPQSYVGCGYAQPLVVNNVMVYAEGRGGHVRELAYSRESQGYLSGDLSIRSPHLFDNKVIVDAAYARAPFPICWFVNDEGALLGLTYIPEQQVYAWHRHDTALGAFESVCCVPEGGEDAVYVLVKRTIDGGDVRYIERMAGRFYGTLEDAFFVDCGLTYSGAATNTVSGLDHLEGCTVSVLANGAVQPQQVVTGGSITIPVSATKIHVGLPVTADIKTLPPTIQVEAYGQARQKNINKVWLRLYRSSGIFVGPNENSLTELKQRTNEPYGMPPVLVSEEVGIPVMPSWGADAQILVRHEDPIPLTLVSISMEVVFGG